MTKFLSISLIEFARPVLLFSNKLKISKKLRKGLSKRLEFQLLLRKMKKNILIRKMRMKILWLFSRRKKTIGSR